VDEEDTVSEIPVVVLDPGHGGARGTHNRGSSWNRAEGPNGLLEKDVVFDVALRVAARLRDQARVELTRGEEMNRASPSGRRSDGRSTSTRSRS
jgi:N-acetylmuramoyl-L-alanine amidase